MNTMQEHLIYNNLSGVHYDAIMNGCPHWVWTEQDFLDWFAMMTGC